jgi:GrpB-like predicted nucleotidyltransferase (UPF0157 family)
MLGLKKGVVELLPHNEQWHQLFAEEKMRLQNAIGENVIAVEHIGSTSICGIAAKPVLDIAAAVSDKASGEKCVAPLEKIGYEYRGEYGIAERFYFVKGEPRTHHLHILLSESDALKNHLLFRDYLLSNRLVAAEYDKLKKELSEKFQNDRDAYLEGKAEFVERSLKIARSQKV